MTLDETLADLQYQAARLAGHFAAISDRIEAGEAPSPSDFQNSSFATRLTADSAPVLVRQDAPAGSIPQTPQGAAPSGATQGVPAPGAVEVEGEAATPAVAPPPAAPAAPAPWEQQAQAAAEPLAEWERELLAGSEAAAPAADATEAAPAAEAAPKKRSRRTLEEIAADNGVTLDEVKAWLGPDRKATKATIEEYVAATQAAAPQVVEPAPEPAPAAAPAPAPMPTTVANPFGQGAQLPPAAAPQPEPVVAPAPVAAPDFGQGTETIADWNPFQS